MENSKRPKTSGSPTLMKNPFLEKLTRTHISLPLIIFSLIAAVLIYYGIVEKGFGAPVMILLFICGFFFYTLIEYLAHRYVYHQSSTNPTRKKIAYTIHGVHHEYPKDKFRLAMPPVMSVVLATIFFVIYRSIMGDFVFGFLAGFIMGYTVYLGVHYSIHALKVPKNRLKILWHHHSIHHYREEDRAFGVSTPLWDYVFGTMPRRVRE